MKKTVLLTTPYAPYDTAWGEDMMDLMSARLARGHDILPIRAHLPTWALYLIAENVTSPCTILEFPHWGDFMRELARGYDVVAIQLKTLNNARVARMVEAIRTHSPSTEIVIGGYGVGALNEALPGDRYGYAAYIRDNAHHLCRDEGVRFMRTILGDGPVDRPITQYHLPYATYHTPGMSRVKLHTPAVLVSLGCPSACDFCNTSAFYHHKKIRIAEPAQTYDFLCSHLARQGGDSLNAILFDEDLFLDPDYVRELGRLIRSDRKTWGIRWHTFGSIGALSKFTGEELRACGLGGVWIGVESGITDGSRSATGYKKREGTRSPQQLFAELHRYGIETIGSMILGFDFHTPENIERDIDYFVDLEPTFYQVSPLTPCPGTKLYKRLLQAGRLYDHYDHGSFHLWKDDVFQLANFEPGDIKRYFDLAHEKLRTRNGPPVVQFCKSNLSAYETLRDHPDPFLRDQAERSRNVALGALPIVRVVERNAPSPRVLRRVHDIQARARRALGRVPLRKRAVGRVVEWVADQRSGGLDRLERPPVVSDPGARWKFYLQPGKPPLTGYVWWERMKALRRLPEVPRLTSGELRALPPIGRAPQPPRAGGDGLIQLRRPTG